MNATVEGITRAARGACGANAGERGHGSSVAVREVLGFGVDELVNGLSSAWVLRCATERAVFVVTNSRSVYTVAREAGEPVFAGGEMLALSIAAQNDRLFEQHFAPMVERAKHGGRVTLDVALAGMPRANCEPLSWTVRDVLDQIGAVLLEAEVV